MNFAVNPSVVKTTGKETSQYVPFLMRTFSIWPLIQNRSKSPLKYYTRLFTTRPLKEMTTSPLIGPSSLSLLLLLLISRLLNVRGFQRVARNRYHGLIYFYPYDVDAYKVLLYSGMMYKINIKLNMYYLIYVKTITSFV